MRDVQINSIRALDRAIDILEVFSLEAPSLSIDEITAAASLPKATVYRLLYTLERRGLIHYDEVTSRYRLGLRLLKYAGLVTTTLDVRQEAEDILIELHTNIKQTVLMAVMESDELVYVFRRENPDGLKFSSFVGQRRSPSFGVLGHAVLAYLPDEDVERILTHPIPQRTPKTVTDREGMIRRLEQIRGRGYVIDIEETTVGVNGVGAPVFGTNGSPIAAIGIIGPSVQLQGDNLEAASRMLLEATHQLSARMGYKQGRY